MNNKMVMILALMTGFSTLSLYAKKEVDTSENIKNCTENCGTDQKKSGWHTHERPMIRRMYATEANGGQHHVHKCRHKSCTSCDHKKGLAMNVEDDSSSADKDMPEQENAE